METMRIEEEEPTINDEIQPIETFAKFESDTNFKRLWSSTVLDIDDRLLCSDVQMKVIHMYDELWQSFEVFQQTFNKFTMNVTR